ncbi:MAG: hypothetical protein K2G32_01400, partial [Oscillospiraceae bacterium]|nr:hypothetical protein [Oscillospiraceae bacterium]
TNNFKIDVDLNKNAIYKRGSRRIVTVNNTANKLRNGGKWLFSCEMVFFCSNCKSKLALNFNPFSVWYTLPFQMSFVLYLFLAIIPIFHPEILPCMTDIMWWYRIIAGICIAQLVTAATCSLTAYRKVIKYTSNFVLTDKLDGLILPFTELRLSYGTIEKKYIHESYIFSVVLNEEKFHLYLVTKKELLYFHICGIDGEQELMISLLNKKINSGEKVILSLSFEGKFVGNAEVLEIFEPVKSTKQYKSITQYLVQLRTAAYKKEKENVCKLISNVNDLLETEHFLDGLISAVLVRVQDLIISDKFEQAYDLVDVIHALPEISITQNRDMAAYWRDFVVPYHTKWNSDFFEMFREQILDM